MTEVCSVHNGAEKEEGRLEMGDYGSPYSSRIVTAVRRLCQGCFRVPTDKFSAKCYQEL